jgi:hypothetical protein
MVGGESGMPAFQKPTAVATESSRAMITGRATLAMLWLSPRAVRSLVLQILDDLSLRRLQRGGRLTRSPTSPSLDARQGLGGEAG